MNYLVLLGIAIVIVGFALKLDSILIIAVASVSTALIGAIEAAIEAIVTCKEDIKGNLGTTH